MKFVKFRNKPCSGFSFTEIAENERPCSINVRLKQIGLPQKRTLLERQPNISLNYLSVCLTEVGLIA